MSITSSSSTTSTIDKKSIHRNEHDTRKDNVEEDDGELEFVSLVDLMDQSEILCRVDDGRGLTGEKQRRVDVRVSRGPYTVRDVNITIEILLNQKGNLTLETPISDSE